jgi:hypothetical protein
MISIGKQPSKNLASSLKSRKSMRLGGDQGVDE